MDPSTLAVRLRRLVRGFFFLPGLLAGCGVLLAAATVAFDIIQKQDKWNDVLNHPEIREVVASRMAWASGGNLSDFRTSRKLKP